MSLDSIDVDGLERKDRAELATIAEALGGKPTSRTKKADIIGMILDLAGVTSAGPDAAPAAPAAPARNGRNGAAGADTEAAPAEADAEASDGGQGPSDRDRSDEPESKPENEPEGQVDQDQDQGGKSQGGKSQGGKSQGGQNQGGQNKGGQNRNQGGQNQQNQQNQNQGGQNQGEPEPGNRRRRRRRGRDRDRQGEDAGQPQNDNWDGEPVEVAGFLDLRDEGYGFLRVKGFLPSRDDVYVSVKQTRQLGLRKGDFLEGASRPAGRGEKNPALLRIDKVNGGDPEKARERPRFEDLTPLFPDERLRLEREDLPGDMTSRIVDLIAPIGKGQRGLIVSPPKAGKTTVMKTIAQSIEHNNPEVHLMVLLVDERPEEVTDMRRSVRGDVIASTFDRPSDEHTQVAELASERAKRMVEMGKDVVIILDGITRLARAYNLAAPATGRIMSGGIDTGALYPPKKFFGAARNVEEGGSLTILATALVETGSKMDEVIFEEFKGTGNMELRLDRKAAEKRIYPAIDVDASSTRHEELLFERTQLQQVWKLRRVLSGLAAEGNTGAGLELLIDRMRTFPNNDVFLAEIAKAPGVPG
ncbi:MAG TPA: transcription termination factor Rho [Microthrixaceae bacterium]|nr:transcription termination factor Rho [Microthrixaceae bacterium]MCO5307019.1 transcription termination factor Rho [Microthrixaceae bacterium]HMV75143.1 transcription termination factor Rho [Microthrixaceae bacterium]HMX06615.1 transcription termination factor Rho [Microthrixaceae bacterium]HMX66451.1 transcription termination factor Rho [Microthrixaceae bacterium]